MTYCDYIHIGFLSIWALLELLHLGGLLSTVARNYEPLPPDGKTWDDIGGGEQLRESLRKLVKKAVNNQLRWRLVFISMLAVLKYPAAWPIFTYWLVKTVILKREGD